MRSKSVTPWPFVARRFLSASKTTRSQYRSLPAYGNIEVFPHTECARLGWARRPHTTETTPWLSPDRGRVARVFHQSYRTRGETIDRGRSNYSRLERICCRDPDRISARRVFSAEHRGPPKRHCRENCESPRRSSVRSG